MTNPESIKLEESIGIPNTANIANETEGQKKKMNIAINYQFHQILTASGCDKLRV